MTALEAIGVHVSLGGSPVLLGVDLIVGSGELVVLVGPNGAGKTTLLRVLSGELAPTTGRVTLDGRSLHRIRPRELARQRAVLPQASSLQFSFTVREVVEMGRAPHAGTPAEADDDAAVDAAMADTDCAHLANRDFRSLSGGEQARASLARVLAQDTPIVLLDEPTAALDLHHQETVMAITRDLARKGRAVLAVVHDLNLAAAYADRIGLLHDGGMPACGPPAHTLRAHLLAKAYNYPVEVLTHPVRGCPLVVAATPVD